MAEIVAEEFPQAVVSISSSVVREWREFERTSTTVLDVYVKPRMGAYLAALERKLRERGYTGPLTIMQSSGGMTSSRMARKAPDHQATCHLLNVNYPQKDIHSPCT